MEVDDYGHEYRLCAMHTDQQNAYFAFADAETKPRSSFPKPTCCLDRGRKGPIPEGTLGEMALSTVFGKVTAYVEFLHTGADGVPLAQAFRFLAMDAVSTQRFNAAAEQMQSAGFANGEQKQTPIDGAFESWSKLRESVRHFRGCSLRHDGRDRKCNRPPSRQEAYN